MCQIFHNFKTILFYVKFVLKKIVFPDLWIFSDFSENQDINNSKDIKEIKDIKKL